VSPYPPPQPRAHQPGRALRAVALTAVSAGVLVLAAAAFVLSYSGIHAVARQAGISLALSRGYPVILDAMLVIACAAVLSLRGAGLLSRCFAWLSLLVLLGGLAAADALHSAGTAFPHRDAAAGAAILPWLLLLIGFGLLLAMLRHFRLHRTVSSQAAPAHPAADTPRRAGPLAALPAGQPRPAPPVVTSRGEAVPRQAPGPNLEAMSGPGTAPRAGTAPGPDSRTDTAPRPGTVPGPDAASGVQAPAPAGAGGYAEPDAAYLSDTDTERFVPADEIYAAPAAEDEPAPEEGPRVYPPAPQPAFHRMWSSPTPPGDEDQADQA
jgi:hypothetical protein